MSRRNRANVPVAALMLPKLNKPLLALARAIYKALLDNPSFPNPSPTLAVFANDIAAFEDAEIEAGTRAKGACALRDVKLIKVKEDLFHLRDYVQSVVEVHMSPSEGVALIESAAMTVRKIPTRAIPEISAKNADVSGKVKLTAKAVAFAATYCWEYSLDQSTWTPLPETMKSRTEITGLTFAQVYHFRFRAFTRAGWRDYSQVVSLLVH